MDLKKQKAQAECISAVNWLKDWCFEHHLDWHERAHDKFCAYVETLLHCQQQTNLTGFSTPRAIVEELFVDSLQILRVAEPRGPLMDVGTGAGFPAIPIKILRPELDMILVEPRTKRYAFLRLVERELELSKLTIHKCRIESVSVPENLGFAISKAFAPLPEWLTFAKPWAENGADIACLVTRADWDASEAQRTENAMETIGMVEEKSRVYAVLSQSKR